MLALKRNQTSPVNHPLKVLADNLSEFAGITESDRMAMFALSLEIRRLEPQSVARRPADECQEHLLLLDGVAFRFKPTPEGGRQIVSLHMPGIGASCGNFILSVTGHGVETLTPCTIAVVPRAILQEGIATRPAISRALLLSSLTEASIQREWSLSIGRRDARSGLAHLLCELGTRLAVAGLADRDRFELFLSQIQIGDILGLTPVHVNRMIRTLEIDGLIERNKKEVRISDWPTLSTIGQFSDDYLYLDRSPI